MIGELSIRLYPWSAELTGAEAAGLRPSKRVGPEDDWKMSFLNANNISRDESGRGEILPVTPDRNASYFTGAFRPISPGISSTPNNLTNNQVYRRCRSTSFDFSVKSSRTPCTINRRAIFNQMDEGTKIILSTTGTIQFIIQSIISNKSKVS